MFSSLVTLPLLASAISALPLGRVNSPRAETSTNTTTGGNAGTVATAWFEGWNADFAASQVSWSKYTHVTYSFAVTAPDGSLDLSGSGDTTGLQTFVQAAKANNVKALVSVGGWTGSQYWSTNVATAENRTAFVKTLTDFATTNQLDGLDFDWEYPTGGGMACNQASTDDTANYLSFLQELRQSNPNLILTAAASIRPWKDASGEPSADVSEFAKVLNWVAIMNYDEFGQWSSTAGPNSALDDSCAPAASQQGSAVSAVAAWTAAGIPANQLVLGVASYGHAFNVAPADAYASGSGAPTTTAAPTTAASTTAPQTTDPATATDSATTTAPGATTTIGDAYDGSTVVYRRHDGDDDGSDDGSSGSTNTTTGQLALFPAYSKWQYTAGETPALECGVQAQKDVSFTFAGLFAAGYLTGSDGAVASGLATTFDSCSQTPFLYDESKQTLVSYDDARSFAAKGQFIKEKGVLGFAMWEASGDYQDILLDSIRAAVGLGGGSSPTSTSTSGGTSTSASSTATDVPSTTTDVPTPTDTTHC